MGEKNKSQQVFEKFVRLKLDLGGNWLQIGEKKKGGVKKNPGKDKKIT